MKPFWDNLFYDMSECGLSQEEAAKGYGDDIRSCLDEIEDAIESHDGKQALKLIEEAKRYY